MLLEIDDNKTVEDINEKFNECFPYLRLSFYTKAHSWHGRSLTNNIISPYKKIGDITKKHLQGVLAIYSNERVGAVEQAFKKEFGLFVQVVYQIYGQWFETADTDDLTLQQLCSMAEQANLKC